VNFRINRVLQNTRRGEGDIGENYCRRFAHLVEMIESSSDEATTEVISHIEGLEALERALLYVEQHSKATPTDVIFMNRWRDIGASSRRSTLYQKKITDFVKNKGQFSMCKL
jgi:hypothetical protein